MQTALIRKLAGIAFGLLVVGLGVFPSFGRTAAAPQAAPSGDNVLISEFRTRGPAGGDDEFIELFNPASVPIDISLWQVWASASDGTTSALAAINPGTSLAPGQHYLLAHLGVGGYTGLTTPDQAFTSGVFDSGGLALVLPDGTTRVDQVGMSAGSAFREGSPLTALSDNLDKSYERKPGGDSGSCFDSDSNPVDFRTRAPADPQASASSFTPCGAATNTPTPTFTPTRTATRTPSPLPTSYPGVVVINEFLPHPELDWDENGQADVHDEYIELINLGTDSIDLANWKLDDDGWGGSSPYTLPEVILLPRQMAVFYGRETGISLSDGGDTVRLLKPDGRTADLVNYPVVPQAEVTWCRLPDGQGGWSFACRPSPGRPNALLPTPQPGGAGSAGGPSPCGFAPFSPDFGLFFECLGEFGEGRLWLTSRTRSGVFIE